MWPRDWFGDILVKNVVTFCPCLKSLPEAKVKSFVLIPLAEEILKQSNIGSVIWLLLFALMRICNKRSY